LIKCVFDGPKVFVDVYGLYDELRGAVLEKRISESNKAGGLQKHALPISLACRMNLQQKNWQRLHRYVKIATRLVTVRAVQVVADQMYGPQLVTYSKGT